jgi:hypothetical protein
MFPKTTTSRCITLLGVLLLLATPMAVQAQFDVSTNADGTLTIVSYYGPPGAIFIPTNINGLTVTVVGNGFSILPPSSIETSVSIPETVVSIGNDAFAGGGYFITNLNLPAGVTNIGAGAFDGCGSLPSITIPSNIIDIGPYTFASCSSLSNIAIPDGVTNIGAGAFESCSSLASIIIPSNVTQITSGTELDERVYNAPFEGCSGLTNVTILGSPTIGSYAFEDCGALNTVSIAGGVIGDSAFAFCLDTTGIMGQTIVSGLSNLFLGHRVTSIGYSAFISDPISNLVIPGSVTNMGEDAFDGCLMTNITFLPGATMVAVEAFQGVPITSITFPDSMTFIGGGAFYLCPLLTNVVIPASITNLGADAFTFCERLTNVLFLGNPPTLTAPAQGGPLVNFGSNATIYFLPSATGWPSQFGDSAFNFSSVPTALWNPVIQTGDGALGISNGQFGFNITGTANIPIVVEACTNLANPVWTPLTNMSLTNGSVYFSDPNWSNFPVRYYGIGFP